MSELLLQEVNPLHRLDRKRWTLGFANRWVRRDQYGQLSPRHHLVQFLEKDMLARALGVEFKSGGGGQSLFHRSLTGALKRLTFAEHP